MNSPFTMTHDELREFQISSTASTTVGQSPFLTRDTIAEIEWKYSLDELAKRIVMYQEARDQGGVLEVDAATENMAVAMENAANKNSDSKIQQIFRRKANKLRKSARGDDRDNVMKDIGKGLLLLFTTPFFLVGVLIHGTGLMLEETAAFLKGFGNIFKAAHHAVKMI